MEKPDDCIKKATENRGCRGKVIHLLSERFV